MMNEYKKQAMDFCEKNVESMEITMIGKDINESWDDGIYRMKYRFTIMTKKGKYSGYFWGSQRDMEIMEMTPEKYMAKYKEFDRMKAYNKLKKLKEEAKVSRYDILACITKYNPGTFNEFCEEFGYDNDSMKAFKIYQAVCEEWEGISRIFTEKQLEELREIQ